MKALEERIERLESTNASYKEEINALKKRIEESESLNATYKRGFMAKTKILTQNIESLQVSPLFILLFSSSSARYVLTYML